MKTIIAGNRDNWSYDDVNAATFESGFEISSVICGMATGVDSCGWAWAYVNSIPISEHPADWNTHGLRAGPIRNQEMANQADALIAVWDGRSTGTANMITKARKRGLKVFVYNTRQKSS